MHPAVSLFFFVSLIVFAVIEWVTKQVIWNGRPAFHRDYYPIIYWIRFTGGVVAAILLAIYCADDWVRFFL